MTHKTLQQTHEVLAALGQELERQVQSDAATTSIYLEPLLMQTLMATVEFLPPELQPRVHHIIDMARLSSKNYGNYVKPHADKLVNEQVLSFHEEEAAASRELARLRTLDVAGKVEQVRVTSSTFPSGHPQYHPEEAVRWAVLISSNIDRKALLARLYPQLASRTSFSTTLADYERKYHRRSS